MKEKLVLFGTAKLAKEKGFNIPTQRAYINEKLFVNYEDSDGNEREYYFNADSFYENWNKPKWVYTKEGHECFGCKLDNVKYFEACSAPTQSLLQKWLREEHNIHIMVSPNSFGHYRYTVFKYSNFSLTGSGVDSYEEALESALIEALEMI